MSHEETPELKPGRDPKFIVFLQFLLPLSFTGAMGGIIAWIVSLIVLSRRLHDTPSASIGISIVAIPVFLTLLGVFWYVFLGIIRNQDDESAESTREDREGDDL